MRKINIFWHIAAILTVFIWGTTFVSTKYLLENGFGSVEIMVVRFTVAYIILFLLYPVIKKCQWKEEIIFFMMGATGGVLYFLAENSALKITTASNVAMIVSTTPLLSAVIAHFLTKDERISKNTFIGFAVAIIGIGCVVLNGKFILKLNPLGDFLAFLSALSWAFYSIILKKTGEKYNLFFVTRKMVFYALITSVPIMVLTGERISFNNMGNMYIIFNFLFLGGVASALCYVVWQKCISKIGMVTASSYIYLSPMITIITAVIFINENITVFSIAGCIMIITGVYIFNKKGKI